MRSSNLLRRLSVLLVSQPAVELSQSLSLFAQLAFELELRGASLAPDLVGAYETARAKLPADALARIDAFRGHATIDELSNLVTSVATRTQYASDFAHDFSEVVVACRKLLMSTPLPSASAAALSIEWTANHSLRSDEEIARDQETATNTELVSWLTREAGNMTPSDVRTAVPAALKAQLPAVSSPRVISDKSTLEAAVSGLRSHGVQVHFLGLDSADRLVRVQTSSPWSVTRESPSTFSNLNKFLLRFPHDIGTMRRTDPFGRNELELEMRTIGSTLQVEKGSPVVVVSDSRLAPVPLNLIETPRGWLGDLEPVTALPSFSWLQALPEPTGSALRKAAWISDAKPPDGDTAPLVLLADIVRPTLSLAGFELLSDASPPSALAGAGLVFVGAHGGVADGGRYFSTVSDELAMRLTARQFARACAGTAVVVLAMCHSGRQDQAPFGGAIQGLTALLLDQGCRCVVAAPWAIDVAIMEHWLPAFLKELEGGTTVAEATFVANHAIRPSRQHPADYLAMHTFGDPRFHFGPDKRDSSR